MANEAHRHRRNQKQFFTGLMLVIVSLGVAATSSAGELERANAANERADYAHAATLYERLAKRGNAKAQYNLGNLYRMGLGVPEDHHKAASLYEQAALQGLRRAQFNLAVMYEQGMGVRKLPKQMAYWFLQAAEQGHPTAQFTMGTLFEKGIGVKRDLTSALQWYALAIKSGHADATIAVQAIQWRTLPPSMPPVGETRSAPMRCSDAPVRISRRGWNGLAVRCFRLKHLNIGTGLLFSGFNPTELFLVGLFRPGPNLVWLKLPSSAAMNIFREQHLLPAVATGTDWSALRQSDAEVSVTFNSTDPAGQKWACFGYLKHWDFDDIGYLYRTVVVHCNRGATSFNEERMQAALREVRLPNDGMLIPW